MIAGDATAGEGEGTIGTGIEVVVEAAKDGSPRAAADAIEIADVAVNSARNRWRFRSEN